MVPAIDGAGKPTSSPATLTTLPAIDTCRVYPEVGGSIESIRAEIDDAFADMKEFLNQEPDHVMRICGGHSARLAEVRVRIQRIEDFHRVWKSVRTREIEPALDQLQIQYTIASRLQSCRELDWKMEGGGT